MTVGHAHAGLLDFPLGVGLPGVLLLIASLLAAARYGWTSWRRHGNAAGLALALFAMTYLARAAVDGIVRDHMLEQAMFMLGMLLAATAFGAEERRT